MNTELIGMALSEIQWKEARGKNVFSQSAHLFTKILTNQISEKTIDFAGEAAQKRPKWRKFGEAV